MLRIESEMLLFIYNDDEDITVNGKENTFQEIKTV